LAQHTDDLKHTNLAIKSITVVDIDEQELLSRYPWPTQIPYERGSEFVGYDFQATKRQDNGIKELDFSMQTLLLREFTN
jgi:hypothetical protein